jgi:hypothetical protein
MSEERRASAAEDRRSASPATSEERRASAAEDRRSASRPVTRLGRPLGVRTSTALAIATLALGGAAALAQSEIALHVRTVLATDHGSDFDQRLDRERGQLKGLFRGYSSYRLVKEEDRRCPVGSPNNFEIPGGRYLQVMPIGAKEDRVKLKVTLLEGGNPPPLDTDVTLANHGNFWLGGPKHPDGVLLISIGAEAPAGAAMGR